MHAPMFDDIVSADVQVGRRPKAHIRLSRWFSLPGTVAQTLCNLLEPCHDRDRLRREVATTAGA